jgi:hypothetical protein
MEIQNLKEIVVSKSSTDNVEPDRETRVTGLLENRDAAKKTVTELKGAGFSDRSILIAMENETEQESLIKETQAQAIAEDEIPTLPELSAGQVLIMVEAEDRASEALNILNCNNAVTGGVRIPTA